MAHIPSDSFLSNITGRKLGEDHGEVSYSNMLYI